MNDVLIWDIEEALENFNFWKPIYEAMLKRGVSKKEAIEAIKYLIEIEKGHDSVTHSFKE